MNIFKIPSNLPDSELFEGIINSDCFRVERIISTGQVSKNWYDQSEDEWVVLVQGEAKIEFDSGEEIPLFKGDELFIPAHQRHRVTYTSTQPVCIWICVFSKTNFI